MQFHQGQFVFVDVPAILDETKLIENRDDTKPTIAQIKLEIQQRLRDTFIPYVIMPLLGHAYGRSDWVRQKLFATTLSTATSTLTWRDILPSKHSKFTWLKTNAKLYFKLKAITKLTDRLTHDLTLDDYFRKLETELLSLPLQSDVTGYVSYYEDKQENLGFNQISDFNQKQKNVYKILLNKDINSVLDVACNTGWFAKLAADLGKEVTAFDIDESCINILYRESQKRKLKVLPLVMSITQLTPERFSPDSGNKVLLSADRRLASDCVLALGIIHHLHLGLGHSLDEIFSWHANLSKKCCVIEYVDLTDDRIKTYTWFFS